MSQETVIRCDKCKRASSKLVTLFLWPERYTDGAGSMDTREDKVDLCGCCIQDLIEAGGTKVFEKFMGRKIRKI